MAPILALEKISKRFGATRALENVPGSRVARFAEMQTFEQTGRAAEALAIAEALASELGPERLAGVRELWQPLFRLRVLEQLRRPAAERDWSGVDSPDLNDDEVRAYFERCAMYGVRLSPMLAWCSRGTTTRCTGACGAMSSKAITRSSLCRCLLGISPAMIVQKRQSLMRRV